jgi:hypothetical protein
MVYTQHWLNVTQELHRFVPQRLGALYAGAQQLFCSAVAKHLLCSFTAPISCQGTWFKQPLI